MLSIVKSVDDPVHRVCTVNRSQTKDNRVRRGSREQDAIKKTSDGELFDKLYVFFLCRTLRTAIGVRVHEGSKGHTVNTGC